MYSPESIFHGLKNPSLIPREIRHQIKKKTPHDFGIQGSYYTGNIGDRALAEQFKNQIQKDGHSARIFGRNTRDSNTPHRVLGGGGVLHDWYGTEHLKRRLAYVNGGEKGFIIGVGVPGFQSSEARDLVSRILPELDLITVRDEWSKRNIKSVCDVDVSVTACPVFLYEDPDMKTAGQTGVNFRPYFGQEDKQDSVLLDYFGYEDIREAKTTYIDNAQKICEQIPNPIFIPFHSTDEEFARKYLDVPILDYDFSVETTLKRVSRMERMVATRYHSLIFAAICGKPVLPIAYEPKVKAVAERLEVPSYKPHKEIPLQFSQVSNVDKLKSLSKSNFNKLYLNMQK
ncbi:polysaccharide pyruvyl transferase family protein [Haloterrigena sp. SYSU A558-1]|uniref:Polysaccharide pyruvyl transferase family protein n=1 Tax=Haloterrigena gelatinilytica TaxID=2741724 RepID=A0ABX2LC89_9EURY|nr:polysaccharide pyruvyl transferase family protein [Haloterrigena gelatinilytica]NUC72769.1 polysaccharide pyruvyl transferase family protein [Haloterrigena gelatinilytica]